MIASEHIAHRSFLIWSKILKKAGKPETPTRNFIVTVYVVFLLTMILTVVPLNLLLRRLSVWLRGKNLAQAVTYYEQPSGK